MSTIPLEKLEPQNSQELIFMIDKEVDELMNRSDLNGSREEVDDLIILRSGRTHYRIIRNEVTRELKFGQLGRCMVFIGGLNIREEVYFFDYFGRPTGTVYNKMPWNSLELTETFRDEPLRKLELEHSKVDPLRLWEEVKAEFLDENSAEATDDSEL